MNNFQTAIGVEIHTSLNTKTKMFSPAMNSHSEEPNSVVHFLDIGLPGVLPLPNAAAVEKAIILCRSLQTEIDTELVFDRKNYFYHDLPKGYQITQQFRPIGKNGRIFLEKKTIDIERIQIEEDTAKKILVDGKQVLNYNRCGIPLIEIVTGPSMNNEQEVQEFLIALKRILMFSNVSDGKMEDGSLRVDLNISVAPHGTKKFGQRVEVKNINSFANVSRAIKYEQDRQIKLILSGQKVQQETRRWDDNKNQTVFMREKINARDYRYFVEPNIVKMPLPTTFLSEISARSPKLPHEIQSLLEENGVNKNIINQLLDDIKLYSKFEYVYRKINNVELAVTWVIVEMGALCKKEKITYDDIEYEFLDRLSEMLVLIKDNKISGKQAKVLFEKMYSTKSKCQDLITKLNIAQITDNAVIKKMLENYINQNPQMISQYKDRPERVEKFFVGLIMRDTKGQANPTITINTLREIINETIK